MNEGTVGRADEERQFLEGFAGRLRDLGKLSEPPLAGHTDLANACDVAVSTAHGWLNGVALPRNRLFELIAKRLGVPVYALFLFREAGADGELIELVDFMSRLPEERRRRVSGALLRFAAVLAAF
jgi:transcriptional regulator with XRE-family HTH domain